MEIEEPVKKTEPVLVKIDCYFSQINDIASQIGFHSFEEMTQPTQPLHMVRTKRSNCYAQIKEWGLSIVSKGGAQFNIPLEQDIEAIFPMSEGLLIQFTIKQEPKFSQILYLQRNKHLINTQSIIDEPKFSYVTINKHPLNPLKLLNYLKNDIPSPWKNLSQQITYVDQSIPLIISYNHSLQRNAFHLLRVNPQEIQKQNSNVTFLNNFYTLKTAGQSQQQVGQIVTQILYEQNTRQDKIKTLHICRGRNNNQIILNAIYGETRIMKIFLIKFLETCQTQLLGKISNLIYAQTFDLFDSQIHPHTLYQQEQQPLYQCLNLNNQIVINQLKYFKQFLIGVESNNYFLMFNGQLVYKFSINNSINTQIISVNKLADDWLEINSNKGTSKLSHVRKLTNPLTISILKILSQILNQEMYIKILSCFINLKENKQKNKPQFETLKLYLVSLYTGLIDPTILKFNGIQKYQEIIHRILHLLYQQLKLFEYDRNKQDLLDLLFMISVSYPKPDRYLYCDYYLRQGANNPLKLIIPTYINTLENYQPIPDIFKFVKDILKFSKDSKDFALQSQFIPMPIAFRRTKFVVRLLEILIYGETGKRSEVPGFVLNRNLDSIINKQRANSFYPIFVQSIFQIKYFMRKMQGFLDLREMFQLTQVKQQKAYLYIIERGITLQEIKTFPSSIAVIIYEILRMMRQYLPGVLYSTIPELGFNLIRRQDIYKNIKFYKRTTIKPPEHLQSNGLNKAIQSLIHSSTSQSYYLNSNSFEMNKTNNDLVFGQVNRLLSSTQDMIIRHKQLENIPQDRWQLQSQTIVSKFANRRLSVLVGQGSFTLGTSQTFITQIVKINKINLSASMPNDMVVALDLKQSTVHHWAEFHNGVATGLRLSKHIIPLSQDHLKTWIFYQKPETPKRDHSGFLLALGLMGYLKCFSPTDIYQYLKPNNQLTSIALLLGVSSSHVGKCEQYITQTLVIHVLPSTVDMDIPINVQTAALIGIGLIHKGTCNRTMVEMALSQIGRSPNNDKCLDRQGYSLAAGWALGLICLGSAGKRSHLDDLQLQKRMIRYIEGGKIMDPPQTMISNSFARQNKCSSIRQGPNVNIHITAPSALLAITLMYLKSNNSQIAKQITIPESFNMIEQCNPNLILLKVIAKNLIMWKNIENTSDFLYNQIPQLVKFIYESTLQKVHESYYLVYNVNQIDYHTISTIYASTLTGAVVAMAMKYAGTGDSIAVNIIKDHIEKLGAMKVLKYQLANDPINKNCIDQYTLFTLLSTSILALSIIVAGTCDAECLRIAKTLRKKIQQAHSFHYGFNMAINMAIGFICLGYGNYSFNRSDLAIASLLISIYPMFPNSPTDNKWHLQALRHFYVLAVQQKVFHAVDVDTNKVVNLKVQMCYQIGNQTKKDKLNTPILLQQSKKLLSIRVVDDNYFDIDFNFDQGTLQQPRVIYVKRKLTKSIQNQQLQKLSQIENPQQVKNKSSFSRESQYQALKYFKQTPIQSNQLLHLLPNTQSVLSVLNRKIQPYFKPIEYEQLYYQFLKEDRLQILQIYLGLIENKTFDDITNSKIQNLKVIELFYKNTLSSEQSKFFSLTNLGSLYKSYIKIFQVELNKIISSGQFNQYVKNTSELNNNISSKQYRLAKHLQFPNRYELHTISSFFKKILETTKVSSLNQNDIKKLKSVIQMHLFVTFPSCRLSVLNTILDLHLH